MGKVIFYGEVADGVLKLDRQLLLLKYIQSLPEGMRLEITVQKESEDNTNLQYAYLYGVVVAMGAESLGYSRDEMIGVFKKRFLTKYPDTTKEYVQSLTEINRAELAKFIDECSMCLAELGVIVPPANPRWKLDK